ncbi:MAG: DNA polymerase III subunit gamma/tau [Nannocystaceae bacterium]
MAYVVLARKYRPQRFTDLIGQEHVTRTLANAIAHDRVHHAYLFCGARGLGKTTTARLLAKCLVCEKGPTSEPCNECSECRAVIEGRSVDVIEIDGASNNRVDDVRNLRDQVRYLPQTARRKIYIIDEVHMLTGSAFNALLKTLEEPPEHVTFIFATTEVHELPATILSRVSRFDFRRLASARLVEHMQSILTHEGVTIEEAGLFLIARAGGGSVRDSLTLLDKVIAFADDSGKISAEEVRVVLGVPSQLAVAALAKAVLGRDADATLREFDQVVASGQDLQQLAIAFLQHLRNLVVVKLTASREVLIDASEAEFAALREQSADLEPSVLSQLFDRFSRVVDGLAHTRVPRLILEMGLLDLVHAEPLLPLGDLIGQLEHFSRGAPGLGGLPGGSPRREISSRAAPPARTQGSASPNLREAAPQRPSPAPARQPAPASAPAPARHAAPERAPSPPRPAAPSRGRGGEGEGQGFGAELWKMVQASGAVGPGGIPSGPPSGPPAGGFGGAPRERSSHRDARAAPSEPPEEPDGASPPWPEDDGPPWPPDDTVAAAPRAAPSRRPEPSQRAPSVEAAEDPTCATGACPGAPRPTPEEAIDWASLDPFDAWERLLARISETDPQLSGPLADAGFLGLADGTLRLVCPADQHQRLYQIESQKGLLTELSHVHFGAPFAVEVIHGEPSLPECPSLTLVREQRRLELQREVDEAARAHPGIRAVLDAFEGELRSVKPLVRP